MGRAVIEQRVAVSDVPVPVLVLLLLFAPKPPKPVVAWLLVWPKPPKPPPPNDIMTDVDVSRDSGMRVDGAAARRVCWES